MDNVQVRMLRAYMRRTAWLDYRDSLKPELLGNTMAVALLGHMNALHEASDKPELDVTEIAAHIEATYGDTAATAKRRDDILGALDEIANTEFASDEGTIHAIFRQYLGREWGKHAARTLLTTITSGELDFKTAEEQLCNAVDAVEGRRDTVLDYASSVLPDRDVDRPGVVPTGLSARLDAALSGGLGNGEFLLYVGGTGVGKTSALTATAATLLNRGKCGLYVSLEISEAKVARRVDSALTGLTYEGMLEHPGVVEATRRRVLAKGGALYIKNWAYTRTSASAILVLVKKMRRKGKTIDFVVIDYAGKMVPDTFMVRREVRHNFGAVCEDIRRIAQELQVPIFSAWQTNREGQGADTVRLTNMAEAFDPAREADIAIGLSASAEEQRTHQMRLGILKQRESTLRPQFYVRADLDRNFWGDLHNAQTDEPSEVTTYGPTETTDQVQQDSAGSAGAAVLAA